MGIGDRDYMRNEGGGAILRGMTAVQGIVALNIAVFLLWQFGDRSFMRDNFLVSYSQLENWRLWTLLTSVFSHNLFWHILINLLVFASFGPALEQRWGSRKFLVFYLGCGIFASLVHCGMHFLDFPDSAALGASGSVCGVVTAFAILYPKQILLLWGIVPTSAWALVAAFSAWDLYGLFGQKGGGGDDIGHAAHLGGVVAAFIFMLIVWRPKKARAAGGKRRDPSEFYPSSEGLYSDRKDSRLDYLLSKVSEHGLESLSADEKEELQRISDRRRRQQ